MFRQCDVISEEQIRNYLVGIEHDRILLSELSEYCENHNRYILALSGLRRTGKTVLMMRQALNLMEAGKNVAYLQIREIDTQQSLFLGVESAVERGAQYIFIDEVTYVDGFARWGDWIYTSTVLKGIYCIICGTDSFGLVLASGHVLFDRVKFVKTTHMPYADYNRITGRRILNYLHNGGIFGELDVDEYIKTSIVSNIVDSINRYSDYGYKELAPLEDAELRSAIIKTIANVAIRFALRLLTRPYKYPDMQSASEMLSKRDSEFSIQNIDAIQKKIYERLGLKENLERFSDKEKSEFVDYLKYILRKIDVITQYDYVQVYPDMRKRYTHEEYIITQPGMRYEQTRIYLNVLNKLNTDSDLLQERIAQDMEGRLLEAAIMTDIIRKLHDKCPNYSSKKHDIFKFSYGDLELDMVVAGFEKRSVSLFEIKRATTINRQQYANLLNPEIINAVKKEVCVRNVDKIDGINTVNCYVLYMGEPAGIEGVQYINIEDFLLNDTILN